MSAPSYKENDPKGWCGDIQRGAALGRPTVQPFETPKGKLYLRRVYLDNGGYDTNGTYFGHGEPLYWVASEDCELDYMLRAKSRRAAKEQILEKYPDARFFQ